MSRCPRAGSRPALRPGSAPRALVSRPSLGALRDRLGSFDRVGGTSSRRRPPRGGPSVRLRSSRSGPRSARAPRPGAPSRPAPRSVREPRGAAPSRAPLDRAVPVPRPGAPLAPRAAPDRSSRRGRRSASNSSRRARPEPVASGRSARPRPAGLPLRPLSDRPPVDRPTAPRVPEDRFAPLARLSPLPEPRPSLRAAPARLDPERPAPDWPAPARPDPEPPDPARPDPAPPDPVRAAPARPVPLWPDPVRDDPALDDPDRPVSVRPVPVRPVPDRPVPVLPELARPGLRSAPLPAARPPSRRDEPARSSGCGVRRRSVGAMICFLVLEGVRPYRSMSTEPGANATKPAGSPKGVGGLRHSKYSGGDLLSQEVPLQVPSAQAGLTAVFGMGTGVSPPPWPPENCQSSHIENSTASTNNKNSKPSAD